MESKINVAELLKDCPHGMELDCVLFNNPVRYDGLDNEDNYPITILTENDDYLYLTEEGYLYNMPNSKCVIFPKGKTTWEGFVPPCKFKVGDRVKYKNTNICKCIRRYDDILNYYATSDDYIITLEKQDDWELVPNKFDISTLVPFESRVLVRSTDDDIWRPAIYGFTDSDRYYVVGGIYWKQCIPYEGNEHLLGTNNDCDKYFKIWE